MLKTLGIYAGPNHPSRAEGSFIKRLWSAQAGPIDEIDAGEATVKEIPEELAGRGKLTHTRWDGEAVVLDNERKQIAQTARAAFKAKQAQEEADAQTAWAAIATVAGLTVKQKAAFGARLGFEDDDVAEG